MGRGFDEVARIFAEGRQVTADARPAFLDAACGGDAALREEVDGLLREHDRAPPAARDPLAGSGLPALAASLLGAAPDARADDLPRVVGFRVVRRLAEGGMGTVYLAEQEKPRRPVALKVLRPEAASPEGRRRFEREAEVLAKLEHPGIARVLVFGTTEPPDPRPFLAMEYIEGVPLTTAARALGLRERIALLAEVAEAVAHAHARGVVHRDLKPENVLVLPDGRPKVVDFGVARLVAADAAQRTQAGLVIGTLAYMSPEQVRGDVEAVDTRSDVYALGVVAYEVLSGRHPLGDAAGTFPELAARIARETPPDPGEVDRRLRGDVTQILRKALEKEPEQRYAGAAALADDLRRHLRDEPILARPLTGAYQIRRLVRRHKKAVAAGVLALGALVTGLVVAVSLARAEQRERLRADAGAEVLRRSLAQRSLDVAAGALREFQSTRAREALVEVPEEFRGWEWRYLSAAVDGSIDAEPIALDHVSDGRVGVAGDCLLLGAKGEVSARGVGDAAVHGVALPEGLRRALLVLLGGAPGVLGQQGDQLVLADSSGRASWQARLAATGAIEAAAGSDDGSQLAVAFRGNGSRCVVAMFDARTGTSRWRSKGGRVETTALAFSPDARRLASCGWEANVRIFDVGTGAETGPTLSGHTGLALSLGFSPDGTRLVSGSRDRTARVWDLATGAVLARLVGHGGDVTAVAFSPDGRRVATGGADATVRLWDASTGAVLQVLLGHEGTVRHIRFGPGDDVLTSLAGDGVRRWSAAPDASVLRFHRTAEEGNPHPYVYAAEFSPDGQRLATAGWDGTVRVVEAATGERLLTIEIGESSVRDVRWTPDGRFLVGGHDRVVRWDAFTGEEVAAWKGTGTDSVAITPDGTQVVTGDSSGRVRLHRITDLEPVSTWKAHNVEVFDLSVSPDGSRVASISLRGLVVVHDRATGAERWRRRVHLSAPFGAVAFSPDGRRLATGGGDRTVRVLDAATGDEIRVLRGHNDAVYGLAWTPDGTRLLSGSNDATLRVWDPDAGVERLELRGHGSYVYRVAVSPDGATVATASGDETARTWSAVPAPERERRARAARSARADADALVDARLAAGAAPRDLADEWLRDASAGEGVRTARLHALMRRVDRDRAPHRKPGG